MPPPLFLGRFRREHNKKRAVKDGFFDPITWIDTGNYALNKMISGDFHRGIPIGGVVLIAGETGSAKSLLVSGNIVRNALASDATVLLLETEGRVTPNWLRRAGVDPEHPNLAGYFKSTVNDIAQTINDFMSEYVAENRTVPRQQQPKVLIVVDSLGFIETDSSIAQFENADIKGDKGLKAKQLRALVSNCIRLFRGYEVGMVATNHTYKAQEAWQDDVISGGTGVQYGSSIVVSMNKLRLREDAKVKGSPIIGIQCRVKCTKTDFAKPFEEVVMEIPYETGVDRYSGLFDMALSRDVLVKDGNRYRYTAADGTAVVRYRKDMDGPFFDRVIAEWRDDAPAPTDHASDATAAPDEPPADEPPPADMLAEPPSADPPAALAPGRRAKTSQRSAGHGG